MLYLYNPHVNVTVTKYNNDSVTCRSWADFILKDCCLANWCSRRSSVGFWDGSGPACIPLRVASLTSRIHMISVFIAILNKCREKSQKWSKKCQVLPAALTAELNQTTVNRLKTFRLVATEQRPISGICVEISSILTQSHRKRERAACYSCWCYAVQLESSGRVLSLQTTSIGGGRIY